MARIAVISAGIAGMTAAYRLSMRHELFLLEREDRVGGHTHTVLVDEPGGPVPVDTGFIVFNEGNYRNLVALFAELGVTSQPSDMSFSVSDRESGFELRAQAQWNEVSGHLRTHDCGACRFHGFHEDGVRSALRVAESIG